jgi:hypothetical protein
MSQPRFVDSWVGRLGADLKKKSDERGVYAVEENVRAAEVRQQGPAVFNALGREARTAAIYLGFKFDSGANWWTVKDLGFPFRMLQAVFNLEEMGINLIYTESRHSGVPKTTKDFIDLRIEPGPERMIILMHRGLPIQPGMALELMFRGAFLPTAAVKKKADLEEKLKQVKELVAALPA